MALLNQDRKPAPPPADPNYPCWRYSATKPDGVLVRNAEQEIALGDGWSAVPPPPPPPAGPKPTYEELEAGLRDLIERYQKLQDEHTDLLLQIKSAELKTKKAAAKLPVAAAADPATATT